MARAQFQKGQKVWVESVGLWADVERVIPVWAKGFDEPVRVTYDVGLGREFQGSELQLPESEGLKNLGNWRVLRARNKWQDQNDCAHHPFPGSYPVVVTDEADWGGWRVPGAEYDRLPEVIEQQARIIAAAPDMLSILNQIIEAVDESPMDAPPEARRLAEASKAILRRIHSLPMPASRPALTDRTDTPTNMGDEAA
ncbi:MULTISPECIES: hypothetical protein [Brevundimonas]|uniref:hypothetical protein n=1 Tax=Brevundimonas pishanensis TaxID=2896315 RepID=UPI001FA71B1C|nr:hypothetical protein [Brevundimonas pishanensis]